MRMKALLATLVAVFAVLGVLSAPSASADRGWPPVRYRHLADQTQCLDGNGHAARLWTCNYGPNQLWHYSAGASNLMLSNDSNDWCLDGNGTGVYLNPCNVTNAYQRWDAINVNGHIIFKHRRTGTCIESRGPHEHLTLTTCTYFNVQAFDFFL
ncbi:MAG: hypothetical protein HOV94_09720 [Saccharothrix sp.]|nr:hypothetical protein [Saccharothrix sp.]